MVLDSGERWEPEDFQLQVIEDVFSGVPETWLIVPEGNGKALDVLTPLPLADGGYILMRDVKPGDHLVGSDGRATLVTLATPVALGRPCYRVTFSDGASIVADGEHLWAVESAADRYSPRVMTTEALLAGGIRRRATHWTAAKWRVRNAARQGLVDDSLPVDPYVLGVWLGDGASDCGRVTNLDDYVWERIEAAGYHVGNQASQLTRAKTQTVLGLQGALRGLGLMRDKRIPARYLAASFDQRLALLQGLMDTDGTVSSAGAVTFGNTNESLTRGVRELVWSLGLGCSWREDRAKLYGVDCGPCYHLSITADAEVPVVSLPRKAERLKPRLTTARHRRIASIEPVESRPVRCIQVDAGDHLYLAGEAGIPTHNTTLMSGLALYHGDYRPDASVLLAASSRDQCGLLLGQAQGFIVRTPGLEERFRVFEGYRKITCLRTRGRIQVFASDDRTGDGVIPTLALLDELHRHKSMRLYRTWRGKLGKRGGQLVAISTAGEPGSEFETTRERARTEAPDITIDGRHTRAASDEMVLHDFSLHAGDDPEDLDLVKAANPFSGVIVQSLRRKRASPSMTVGHWRRFVCNLATRTEKAAIGEDEWHARLTDEPVLTGSRCDVGLDLGWKWDATAAVPLVKTDWGHVVARARIITPPRDGNSLRPEQIQAALLDIHAETPIERVVLDPSAGGEQIAAWIEGELGAEAVSHSQKTAPMALAAGRWMEALRNDTLRHVSDPEMTRHVLNAVAIDLPDGTFKFGRPSSSRSADAEQPRREIDALIAASMVYSVASVTDGSSFDGPLFEVLA